jgi:acyl carrier protein phosphodiesterase
LTQRVADLPPKLQQFLPRMIADDWLSRYATFEGLDEAFVRMKRRVKFENQLEQSVEQLKIHYEGLEADFLVFFPDLIQHIEKQPHHPPKGG